MALVNAGAYALASLLIGDAAIAAFNNSNLKVGVGDSSTAVANTQTDLQAPTNKVRQAVDGGFPTRTNGQITAQATYNGSTGNFVWNEWGWFNAAAAGTMFNRVVASLGTKGAGSTWIFTSTATIVAP